MRDLRIAVGTLLAVSSVWMLLVTLGFSTLAAAGLKDGSPEWWATVLAALLGTPDVFIDIAGVIGGVCLRLDRPGPRMTKGRLVAMGGILAVLLGLFWRAAIQERQWIESRRANPDGTSHVVKEYRNWFGVARTVEADEP
ncbi:hypothetical protein EP7_005546 (plasmid) [Isosphaeraceae bacterium EP7]